MPLTKTILVVDDDEYSADVICELIESLGHNSLKAKYGEEAISAYKEHRPDLVLMDYEMPVLNGIDASLKILDDDPNTKIVLMTADRIDKNDKRLDRIITVIQKPFSAELLKSIIDKNT